VPTYARSGRTHKRQSHRNYPTHLLSKRGISLTMLTHIPSKRLQDVVVGSQSLSDVLTAS